jgi:hypothetical protein
MPLYQYRDIQRGVIVELIKPVAERDMVPAGLKRISVPERLAVFGTSSDPKDEHSADHQVPRAYRQLEEQTGGREFLKESGFSTDDVKQAWGM